jgi:signal transduction histidine kinase
VSVRLRLTLLYGGLFVITAAILLGVNYFVVSGQEHRSARGIICRATNGFSSGTQVGIFGGGTAPSAGQAAAQCTTITHPVPGVALPGAQTSVQLPALPSGLDQATVADEIAHNVLFGAQQHAQHTLLYVSAIALGVMGPLSLLCGWLVAGRALRPVHRITETARRLSGERLHERLALSGPEDELKEMADTFDEMLERLEHAFDSQRRFVANASHELLTPLATERVLIDEALSDPAASLDDLRGILGQLRSTGEETERLIAALLVLARSERGVDESIDVDLAWVAASTTSRFADHGVEVRTDLAPCPVTGDPALLNSLVTNLVENAVRYNRAVDGWVSVRTAPGLLEVANSGPTIGEEEVRALFEPFARGDGDRVGDGFGLGLSIVSAVVAAHSGTIDTRPGPEGGLAVSVRFADRLVAVGADRS